MHGWTWASASPPLSDRFEFSTSSARTRRRTPGAETTAASSYRTSGARTARVAATRYDGPLVWRTTSRRPGPARVLGPAFGRSSGSGGNFAASGKLEDGVCSRLCEFGSTYTMPTDALDTTGAKFHAFREMTFSGVDGPRRRRLLGPLRTRSLRCRRSHGLQVDVRDTPRRRRPAALAVEPPRRRQNSKRSEAEEPPEEPPPVVLAPDDPACPFCWSPLKLQARTAKVTVFGCAGPYTYR